jgi:hypothetical protein
MFRLPAMLYNQIKMLLNYRKKRKLLARILETLEGLENLEQ